MLLRNPIRLAVNLLQPLSVCTAVAALMAFSAHAQDKREIVVPLSNGTISIPLGIADSLADRLDEQSKQRAALSGDPMARVPMLLISKDPVATLTGLSKIGLSPTEKLSAEAYVVLARPQDLDVLRDVPGLSAIDVYPATAKIAADVNRTKPFEWQIRSGGLRAYSILVFPGTTAKEIEALREFDIVQDLEEYDPRTVETVRVFTAVLDPDAIMRLAEVAFVARIEPAPPPDIPDNLNNTQPLSQVDVVQIAPYNLSGSSINVGVWEATDPATNGFGIRNTHLDLAGRVTVEETSNFSAHATHVAGTIAASGANVPAAEGMAPSAGLSSYGSASDASEMTAAKNSAGGAGNPLPIVISNHSYGIGIGWSSLGVTFSTQASFGQYTNSSAAFDNVVTGTDLIVVKSGGNDRNDIWNGTSTDASIPTPRPGRDCRQGGLGIDADCLGPRAVAKNVITVGAATPGGAIAGFSSYGPTDDGRIKPDIMANGTSVTSLGAASNTDNFVNQGTSMAAPAISGIIALLLEEAGNQGLTLGAAAVKAILIQTAQDMAGTGQATIGPDFATGWGIGDAQAAVDLIRLPAGAGLAQETLSAAGAPGAYTQAFLVPAGLPEMHMTLAWSDPAGSTTAAQNVSRLVNDLDLRLIDPNGNPFAPWTLNPAAPGSAATRNGGDDARNNVEQVSILSPMAGVWQVQVTAKVTSFTGPQNFAIAGPLSPVGGPFVSDPADIVMVLDRSGSMNLAAATPGLTKLEALKSAADEVANFLEMVGGHQLGIVQFSSTAGPTSPSFELQPIDSGTITIARSAISGINGNGGTNIIDGITRARDQLAGPAALNTRQAIILFSDGRHNTPSGSNVADIDTIMASDTTFYSIGFGTDVDSTILPGIATNHNGVHLEEQTLTAAELSKLFLSVAGVAVDETIVLDPDYVIQPGGYAVQPVILSTDDRIVTFATHWNSANAAQFDFYLQGPDDRCRVPVKGEKGTRTDVEGVQVRRGERYSLIRVALPFKCPFSGDFAHEGEWRLGIRSNSSITDTAKVVVLSKSTLQLLLDSRVDSGKLMLVARLERDGKIVVDGTKMIATLTVNWKSTGDSAKEDATRPIRPTDGRIPKGDVLGHTALWMEKLLLRPDIAARIDPALLKRLATRKPIVSEGAFKSKEMIRFELRDDGREGDEVAFDGRFTGVVELRDKRLYGLHVGALLPSKYGQISREALTSVLVK